MSHRVRAYRADAAGSALQLADVSLPEFGPEDVEVEVHACSLCHSDLHLLSGEWSAPFPLVPGHEIVGTIVHVGSALPSHFLGQRVGLGWQCGACFACVPCLTNRSQLCTGGKVRTCVGRPGGLADRVRADHRFVVPVPPELPDEIAAPLMCAGLTVFGPLSRFAFPGATVGVVGVGGLGHLAIQFARALGARVFAFDPDSRKRSDARRWGAEDLIQVSPSEAPAEARAVEFLLVTAPGDLAWNSWLSRMPAGSTMCLLGVPRSELVVDASLLMDGMRTLTGSVIGSPATASEMFRVASDFHVRPEVEVMPFEMANEAFARLAAGTARYRIVLSNRPSSP